MGRRSAISKAMPKRKKASKKGFSRKDREYFKEFGFLDPNSNNDDDDLDLETHLINRKIYTEEELTEKPTTPTPSSSLRSHIPSKNKNNKNNNHDDDNDHDDDDEDKEEEEDEENWEMENKVVNPLNALLSEMGEKRRTKLVKKFKKKREKQLMKKNQHKVNVSSMESTKKKKEGSSKIQKNSSLLPTERQSGEKAMSIDNDDEVSDNEDKEQAHSYVSHFGEDPSKANEIALLSEKLTANELRWTSNPHSSTLTYVSFWPSTKASELASKVLSSSSSSSFSTSSSSFTTLSSHPVKPRVWTRYLATTPTPPALFHDLLPKCLGYHDVLYTQARYLSETSTLMHVYVVHLLNHVYRQRDTLVRGDVKKHQHPHLDVRDQGFTRPSVLVLVPFRETALRVIQLLLTLSGTEQVPGRLAEEFGAEDLGDDALRSTKPHDYQRVFKGNTDDCFRIGMQLRKSTVKLYTPFYHSDVLVASPLGLRTVIEEERDSDYLSSLDICVLDGAHIMNAQNWEHVLFVMKKLNQVPKRPPEDCDFSRVKSYHIDQLSRHFRQTLIFSEFLFPDLLHVVHTYTSNLVSGLRFQYRPPTLTGTMEHTTVTFPHTFVKLEAPLTQADEARFQYFVKEVLPRYRSPTTVLQKHVLVYFPTYFEYVRVRNYMDQHEYDFEVASEYCKSNELQRSSTLFQQHRTPMLLYTERLHFFKRFRIKGCLHVIFYGVPEHAQFYSELVQWTWEMKSAGGGYHGSVTSLFTKWDALKLERIVGVERLKEMVDANAGDKSVFAYHLKKAS